MVVVIVVWAILYNPATFWVTTYSTWSNISAHAMNGVFAAFEIVFTNIGPMHWSHLPFLILLLALYLSVAYITAATEHFYVYNFLDPSKEHARVAGYVFGIAVAEIVIWLLVRYIIVLREWIVRRARGRKEAAPTDQEIVDPASPAKESKRISEDV